MKPEVSVIVSTYNRPAALERVLSALLSQSHPSFEVIIADDGSDQRTRDLVAMLAARANLCVKHVWQENEGFQAAKIRNKAVAIASGSYLLFLDGDCIPLKHFITKHCQLAQRHFFVAGNRILLSRELTDQVLSGVENPLHWSATTWLRHRLKGDCNRLLPLLCLPIPRVVNAKSWHNVKACNLGIWRSDFVRVNGFDEQYRGWGYEDSDLIIRLLKNRVHKKSGHFAVPVVHLWHEQADRTSQTDNWQRLQACLTTQEIVATKGVQQYL